MPTIYGKKRYIDYICQTALYRIYMPDSTKSTIYARQRYIDYVYQTTLYKLYVPDNTVPTIYTRQRCTDYICQAAVRAELDNSALAILAS